MKLVRRALCNLKRIADALQAIAVQCEAQRKLFDPPERCPIHHDTLGRCHKQRGHHGPHAFGAL